VKTLALIQLTFRESFAKKTFIAFFGISSFVCLLFIFAVNLDIVDGAQSYISLFGQDIGQSVEINQFIRIVQSIIAVALFTGGLFMSLFATSNLIPSLLQKGNIDLIISKPVSRLQILTARYLGAVAIVAFNIMYIVIFLWLILSLKTQIWHWQFLLSGIMTIITFSILYSLMTLLGLLTRSVAFSLMITYSILFFSPLLLQRDSIYALISNKYYAYLVDSLYYILPKTAELGNMTSMIVRDIPIVSWMPLWSSIIFGATMFVISAIIFNKKDY